MKKQRRQKPRPQQQRNTPLSVWEQKQKEFAQNDLRLTQARLRAAHTRLSAAELREVDQLEALIAQLPPRDPDSEDVPRETAAAETQLDELLWRHANMVTEDEIAEQLRLMDAEKSYSP